MRAVHVPEEPFAVSVGPPGATLTVTELAPDATTEMVVDPPHQLTFPAAVGAPTWGAAGGGGTTGAGAGFAGGAAGVDGEGLGVGEGGAVGIGDAVGADVIPPVTNTVRIRLSIPVEVLMLT